MTLRPFRVQVLDGRVYEHVRDYLVSLCQTELDGYQSAHSTFTQLLDNSQGVGLHRSDATNETEVSLCWSSRVSPGCRVVPE